MNPFDIGMLMFCIAVETSRELCFKRGVGVDDPAGPDVGVLRLIFTRPFLWLGIGFWVIEMISWIIVLEDVPLTIAFPIMSLCYVGIPFLSSILFKESMNPKQWLAAGMIAIGVALVGTSGV